MSKSPTTYLHSMNMFIAIVCMACVHATAADESVSKTPEEATTLGIVFERPASGRFVETDLGFMVPYTATVPGIEVKFTMVPIPGGKHEVTRGDVTYTVEIPPFWMAKTEVTWAEYREYMKLNRVFDRFNQLKIRQVKSDEQVDAVSAPSSVYSAEWSFSPGQEPNQPALTMRQYAAKQYTKWLSLLSEQFYRLPSEVEWEYACRAGTTTAYSFGDDDSQLDKYAWYFDIDADEESEPVTGEVATKSPNAWGLYDMHGNVAEWVLDSDESPPTFPGNGSYIAAMEAIVWPTKEFGRIAKGGSWDSESEECLCNSRMISSGKWQADDPDVPGSPWWLASNEGQEIGFRFMRPLTVPERAERERYWRADVEEIKRAVKVYRDLGRHEPGLVDPDLPNAINRLPKEED